MFAQRWFHILSYVAAIPCLGSAATIVSIDGGAGFARIYGLQADFVSWTQTASFRNVSISVPLFGSNLGAASSGTAYLTNAIGPAASPANLLASTNYSFVSGVNEVQVSLFTGLTLGPGTYYLTLWNPCVRPCVSAPPDPNAQDGGYWLGGNPASALLGPGATNNNVGYAEHGINTAFPPATDPSSPLYLNYKIQLAYTVTGDPVPEPATASLVLAALAAGIGVRAFRHFRPRTSSTSRPAATADPTRYNTPAW